MKKKPYQSPDMRYLAICETDILTVSKLSQEDSGDGDTLVWE